MPGRYPSPPRAAISSFSRGIMRTAFGFVSAALASSGPEILFTGFATLLAPGLTRVLTRSMSWRLGSAASAASPWRNPLRFAGSGAAVISQESLPTSIPFLGTKEGLSLVPSRSPSGFGGTYFLSLRAAVSSKVSAGSGAIFCFLFALTNALFAITARPAARKRRTAAPRRNFSASPRIYAWSPLSSRSSLS